MEKIKILDAYFNEDNDLIILEAEYKNRKEDIKLAIDDNFRAIFEYLDSSTIAYHIMENISDCFGCSDDQISFSKEDCEKIINLIEIT